MNMFDYKACLPFNREQFAQAAAGYDFVLSTLSCGLTCEGRSFSRVAFNEDGTTLPTGTWEIVDGRLCLRFDMVSPFQAQLDCVGTVNDSFFFGSTMQLTSQRYIMHAFNALGNTTLKVGIAVASCHQYRDFTMKRFVRSMGEAGVPEEQVIFFVGDVPEERYAGETDYKGVRVIADQWTAREYTPLVALARNEALRSTADYWLVLHDTCEFHPNFRNQLDQLDVGLDYEVIFALDPQHPQTTNIGLYASTFIERIAGTLEGLVLTPNQSIKHRGVSLCNLARLFCRANGEANQGMISIQGKKDVYGSGTERHSVHLREMGIIKNTTLMASDRSRDRA